MRNLTWLFLASAVVTTACTSAQKRAQEALDKGDYFAAAQGFENILVREPENIEARAGLTESRIKILDTRLIDVRKARQSGNPAGAAEQLLEVLRWETTWKQQPRAAAVFTQQEEVQFARGFAFGELRKSLDSSKPFVTELAFRKYGPFFQESKMAEFAALQARNRQLGNQLCRTFTQESYAGLPYGLALGLRVCAFWGENPKFKGEDAAPLGKGLIRELRLEGKVDGLPTEFAIELAPALNRALQSTPWYVAEGSETVALVQSGGFKFDLTRTPTQLIHQYQVSEEYIDSELVTKTREVPYEATESQLNPATGQLEQRLVVRHRSETYRESVPVKRIRPVQKSYPYGAWNVRQSMQLEWHASGPIAGRNFQLAVVDQNNSEDTQNELEIPSIGLKRKAAVLVDRAIWLRGQRDRLAADFQNQMNTLWQDLYCSEPPTGTLAQAANTAWRCLRLSSAMSAPPPAIDEWHRRTFGLGTIDFNTLLK